MKQWEMLVQEVVEKRVKDQLACREEDRQKNDLPKKRFELGVGTVDVYLTYREAQCMLLFIMGKTVPKVAETLGLSPRTVEYYLSNMKTKLKCRSKSELIEMVLQTPFVSQSRDLLHALPSVCNVLADFVKTDYDAVLAEA